jgi:Domain of unknown function (DUF5625)
MANRSSDADAHAPSTSTLRSFECYVRIPFNSRYRPGAIYGLHKYAPEPRLFQRQRALPPSFKNGCTVAVDSQPTLGQVMFLRGLLTIFIGLTGGCTPPPIPMDAAVNLAARSLIEQSVHIEGRKDYIVEFRFSRDGVQFEKLKDLIGAMGVCQIWAPCPRGIAIPVRWSLQNENGKVVASGEIATIDSSGWSAAYVSRRIGGFTVDPGRYLFKMGILKDVPELAFLKTRVTVYHRTK